MVLPDKGLLTGPKRIAAMVRWEIGQRRDVSGRIWVCQGIWGTIGSPSRTCELFRCARTKMSFWCAVRFPDRMEATSLYGPRRKKRISTKAKLNERDRVDNCCCQRGKD